MIVLKKVYEVLISFTFNLVGLGNIERTKLRNFLKNSNVFDGYLTPVPMVT